MDTTFMSIRLITDDVRRLVGFYVLVTGHVAQWGTEDFAEVVTGHATLAIGSTRTVPLFGVGSAVPASNRTAILEFLVGDVDAEWDRLRDHVAEVVTEPDDHALGQPCAAVP